VLEVSIRHRQGAFTLDVDFAAGPGATVLFGRSGSGKTTLVNAVAGLLRPQDGRIVLDGEVLLDTAAGRFVPPHRRRIGYVFQEARLFPHLSVRGNLLFGQRFGRRGRGGAGEFDRVVDLLGIAPLLDRRPRHLSGGERQRVAIGRALLADPRLLLLDEPLSGLDAARRAEILPYLERLRDGLNLPMVYVSHQVEEVVRLATTLVILEDGRVAAAGPVAEVMGRAGVPDLLGRTEAGALLPARVAGRDAAWGLTLLRTPAGTLSAPDIAAPLGTELRLRIRARDVLISLQRPDGLSARNALPATVGEVRRDPGAATVDVLLDAGGFLLVANITAKAAAELRLAPGMPVHAVIKAVAVDGPP